MRIICLDMENVLWPEIWPEVAKATGVKELQFTTREIENINQLYAMRVKALSENNIKLQDVLDIVGGLEPLPGAVEFLHELRTFAQCIILSDTFEQFLPVIRPKLEYPTIFCNSIVTDENDMITEFQMRSEHSKLDTVRALQSVGIETICAGDSYNDLGMIHASKYGFLFNSTDQIKKEHPEIPAVSRYSDLLKVLQNSWDQIQISLH